MRNYRLLTFTGSIILTFQNFYTEGKVLIILNRIETVKANNLYHFSSHMRSNCSERILALAFITDTLDINVNIVFSTDRADT
jgi:hypothetical protein